jgi:hypothetical protein
LLPNGSVGQGEGGLVPPKPSALVRLAIASEIPRWRGGPRAANPPLEGVPSKWCAKHEKSFFSVFFKT